MLVLVHPPPYCGGSRLNHWYPLPWRPQSTELLIKSTAQHPVASLHKSCSISAIASSIDSSTFFLAHPGTRWRKPSTSQIPQCNQRMGKYPILELTVRTTPLRIARNLHLRDRRQVHQMEDEDDRERDIFLRRHPGMSKIAGKDSCFLAYLPINGLNMNSLSGVIIHSCRLLERRFMSRNVGS